MSEGFRLDRSDDRDRHRQGDARVWGASDSWLVAFRVCVLLGLLCAAYTMTWQIALATAAALAIVATSLVACTLVDTGAKFVARCFGYGAVSGVVATAGLGMLMALPAFSLLVIGALVVAHPVVRRRLSTWLVPQGRAMDPPTGLDGSSYSSGPPAIPQQHTGPNMEQAALEPPSSATLTGMQDDALCFAWRHSFVALREATTALEQARLVLAREAYLDELTRRHPDGMTKWLASGPRAAGNPLPFLSCEG